MSVESNAIGVVHAPRPTPLLTSRRHIDLQRVCSAISPLR
ncbi:putative leader peptide [Streptomyces sp. WI04-05B]|nr:MULTISPECIES: putative leader peptide [unclassified Streptomyces]